MSYLKNNIVKKLLQKQRQGSILVSVLAMFTTFFVFSGFAIDFAMVVAARSQLQNAVETAALSAVAQTATSGAENQARKIFSYSKVNLIEHASIINVGVKTSKKAICVEAKAPVRVYFLNILGINYVDIRARAAAKLESESLDEDTGFAVPYHKQYTVPDYIFNKAGKEIRIVRAPGSCDILVYVGLDNKNGEKTRWVNITGTSSDPVGLVQTFDIGAVSAAKYIRVINDTYTTTPFNISVYLINTAKLIKYSEYASL